jgi:tripartite-type tricarboxylate transporter receptor subunit TctC
MGASLARSAGIEMTHIPYRGGPPVIHDLLGGQLSASINVLSNTLPHVQAGRLRALATTAPQRSTVLPDVPTAREAGFPALEGVEWFGLFVPGSTPANVVERLNGTVRAAMGTETMKTNLAKQAFEPRVCSTQELKALVEADTQRWGQVVRETGFKPID